MVVMVANKEGRLGKNHENERTDKMKRCLIDMMELMKRAAWEYVLSRTRMVSTVLGVLKSVG